MPLQHFLAFLNQTKSKIIIHRAEISSKMLINWSTLNKTMILQCSSVFNRLLEHTIGFRLH